MHMALDMAFHWMALEMAFQETGYLENPEIAYSYHELHTIMDRVMDTSLKDVKKHPISF